MMAVIFSVRRLRLQKVGKANAPTCGLVLVGRTDAPARGADFIFSLHRPHARYQWRCDTA